eukprot:2515587-Prymnesium_polylepis.1
MHVPELRAGSAKPVRRLRHASCVVETPRWANLPAGAPPLPSVLVLGGCYDGGGRSRRAACAIRARWRARGASTTCEYGPPLRARDRGSVWREAPLPSRRRKRRL